MRAIEVDPASPDAYKALGAFHHFQGRSERAIELYDQAVRLDPTYWMALNNGAELLRDAGQFDAARSWFRCALASSPRKLDVLIRMAGLELRAGQAGTAEKYLRSAMMLDPQSDEARSMLAALGSETLESVPAAERCQGGGSGENAQWCDLARPECGSV